MSGNKELMLLDFTKSSSEMFYELLSYDAGIQLTDEDISLISIGVLEETGGEPVNSPWNTVLTINVVPTSEILKPIEVPREYYVIRHSLEEIRANKGVDLTSLEDDLSYYENGEGYVLDKVNALLGTNFVADQVEITIPPLPESVTKTRVYAPDSIDVIFKLKDDADVRAYGQLTLTITDTVDRRQSIDELFTSNLLNGFALPSN